MKQLILTVSLFLGFVLIGKAQQATTQKAVIQTPGVHCDYCKRRIENYLTRQEGVTGALVDLKNKTTTVNWIKDRTNVEEVKTHIANTGYDADDVEADEATYNHLPKPCRTKPIKN